MEQLKKTLFNPEFSPIEHSQEGKIHSFKFKTDYIDVNKVASGVRINNNRLRDTAGPLGHKYKPSSDTIELTEIIAVGQPLPDEPYTITVSLSEKSQHFDDFLKYWKKNQKK